MPFEPIFIIWLLQRKKTTKVACLKIYGPNCIQLGPKQRFAGHEHSFFTKQLDLNFYLIHSPLQKCDQLKVQNKEINTNFVLLLLWRETMLLFQVPLERNANKHCLITDWPHSLYCAHGKINMKILQLFKSSAGFLYTSAWDRKWK